MAANAAAFPRGLAPALVDEEVKMNVALRIIAGALAIRAVALAPMIGDEPGD
jgi:hypothetical protein